MKDLFVSFTSADRRWGDWIAWHLEAAGYQVVYQPWDFRPGENFVLEMQRATTEARRTVLVLSPCYLAAIYTHAEWAAAFAVDPQSTERKLLPIRVAPCQPGGLLALLICVDLVGLGEEEAREALLAAVADARPKPDQPPSFPGIEPQGPPPPAFPGHPAGSESPPSPRQRDTREIRLRTERLAWLEGEDGKS